MRMFLIPLAAIASTTAFAVPASAQWTPQPQGHAYGHDNRGQVHALQVRLNNIHRQIAHLAQRRMISRNEYNRLIRDARQVEQRLLRSARDRRGLTRQEAYNVERQIAQIEQRIARNLRNGRQWGHRW